MKGFPEGKVLDPSLHSGYILMKASVSSYNCIRPNSLDWLNTNWHIRGKPRETLEGWRQFAMSTEILYHYII